jgi:hypothetical protein
VTTTSLLASSLGLIAKKKKNSKTVMQKSFLVVGQ